MFLCYMKMQHEPTDGTSNPRRSMDGGKHSISAAGFACRNLYYWVGLKTDKRQLTTNKHECGSHFATF